MVTRLPGAVTRPCPQAPPPNATPPGKCIHPGSFALARGCPSTGLFLIPLGWWHICVAEFAAHKLLPFTNRDNQCPFTFRTLPLKVQDCTYRCGIDKTHYFVSLFPAVRRWSGNGGTIRTKFATHRPRSQWTEGSRSWRGFLSTTEFYRDLKYWRYRFTWRWVINSRRKQCASSIDSW